MDSNHFYNNQEFRTSSDQNSKKPLSLKSLNPPSCPPDSTLSNEEEDGSKRESAHCSWQNNGWKDISEPDSQTDNEFPSLDSSEDTGSLSPQQAESPYIAQVPNKPAFVPKQNYHLALPAYCSLPQGLLFGDGLIFENQSYQSRKERVTSLESPASENYSDLSSQNENEPGSVFEAEIHPYTYSDNLYFEVGL